MPHALRRLTVALALAAGALANLAAQNQTNDFSPILPGNALPYRVNIVPLDFGSAQLPTLQSYSAAAYGRYWIILSGRTNGLHNFNAGTDGLTNFPPDFQNREVWVIDPIMKQSWHRSLESSDSGLTLPQIDSLTSTAQESVQVGNKLIVIGGYGYDRTNLAFTTFPILSLIDLPTLFTWVTNPHANKNAAAAIVQTSNELFRVTGGAVFQSGPNRYQLVFGQDYEGGYLSNNAYQEYTRQVRSFDLIDYVVGVAVGNFNVTEKRSDQRRRDLNIVPLGDIWGGRHLGAFGGVFTEAGGAWTIPVMVYNNDFTYSFEVSNPYTFKQPLNNYNCGYAPMYSWSRAMNYSIMFGGISGGEYDASTNSFTPDPGLPFQGAVTTITTTGWNNYSQQYGMDATFPVVDEFGITTQLLGAEMQFINDANVPVLPNGLINLDAIYQPTVIGYLFGGIAAQQPNNGSTVASSAAFAVVLTPQ